MKLRWQYVRAYAAAVGQEIHSRSLMAMWNQSRCQVVLVHSVHMETFLGKIKCFSFTANCWVTSFVIT